MSQRRIATVRPRPTGTAAAPDRLSRRHQRHGGAVAHPHDGVTDANDLHQSTVRERIHKTLECPRQRGIDRDRLCYLQCDPITPSRNRCQVANDRRPRLQIACRCILSLRGKSLDVPFRADQRNPPTRRSSRPTPRQSVARIIHLIGRRRDRKKTNQVPPDADQTATQLSSASPPHVGLRRVNTLEERLGNDVKSPASKLLRNVTAVLQHTNQERLETTSIRE
jgi:hypothetical protein